MNEEILNYRGFEVTREYKIDFEKVANLSIEEVIDNYIEKGIFEYSVLSNNKIFKIRVFDRNIEMNCIEKF